MKPPSVQKQWEKRKVPCTVIRVEICKIDEKKIGEFIQLSLTNLRSIGSTCQLTETSYCSSMRKWLKWFFQIWCRLTPPFVIGVLLVWNDMGSFSLVCSAGPPSLSFHSIGRYWNEKRGYLPQFRIEERIRIPGYQNYCINVRIYILNLLLKLSS